MKRHLIPGLVVVQLLAHVLLLWTVHETNYFTAQTPSLEEVCEVLVLNQGALRWQWRFSRKGVE